MVESLGRRNGGRKPIERSVDCLVRRPLSKRQTLVFLSIKDNPGMSILDLFAQAFPEEVVLDKKAASEMMASLIYGIRNRAGENSIIFSNDLNGYIIGDESRITLKR